MTEKIKQKLIKLLENAEGDKALTTLTQRLIKRLEQNDIVFPNNAEGVDRACLIAALILNKNATLFFKNKAQIEANEKLINEFSKSLGLTPKHPELELKTKTRPTQKK